MFEISGFKISRDEEGDILHEDKPNGYKRKPSVFLKEW
jgi:hypothetical protein